MTRGLDAEVSAWKAMPWYLQGLLPGAHGTLGIEPAAPLLGSKIRVLDARAVDS